MINRMNDLAKYYKYSEVDASDAIYFTLEFAQEERTRLIDLDDDGEHTQAIVNLETTIEVLEGMTEAISVEQKVK